MSKIVNIGDGRFIEMTEGGPSASPQVPEKKTKKPRKSTWHQRKKRTLRKGFEDKSSQARKSPRDEHDIPGYSEWLSARSTELKAVHPDPKHSSRMGIPTGMRKAEAEKVWEEARHLAERDIQNMKDAGIIEPADTQAEEAMRATLEVMRSPMDQKLKLAAARQVLEWTKAKPAAKTEMTVNTAEAWLDSLTGEKE